MKVGELVKILSGIDPELEAAINYDGHYYKVCSITAPITIKEFKGTSYSILANTKICEIHHDDYM